MRRSLSLVAALLLGTPAAAIEAKSPGPDWQEANRTDEFVVFTKDMPKLEARDIRAITEVDAPPQRVFEVVGDLAHYPDYMPYVKEVKILKKNSDFDILAYFLLEMPLVSNRDYNIQIKRTVGTPANGGVFKSEWVSVPDATPEREDVVRVKLNTGGWTLEPLDGGKRTRVTYALLTAPGGSIPQWIGNRSNNIAIPDVLNAVRKRSLDPKWKQ